MRPTLLAILGPTAVGKTSLAIGLGRHFGADVISADSRQLYQSMDVGTGKPSLAERGGVTHHFIDTLSPDQPYSAARFAEEVHRLLPSLFERAPVQVMAGGTGFYVKAVAEGFDAIPPVAASIRAQVDADYAAHGLSPLVEELRLADPTTWQRIDRRNPARVRRAVEVIRATGRPFADFHQAANADRHKTELPFRLGQVVIDLPRDELYARIDARVLGMFERGLVAEVRGLLQHFPPTLPALQTIGYREVIAHLSGEHDLPRTVQLVQQHTRHYARRQLTWLRKVAGAVWVDARDPDSALEQIVRLVSLG